MTNSIKIMAIATIFTGSFATSIPAAANSALAVGDCAVLGLADNLPSAKAANDTAMANCRSNGGKNCKVIFTTGDAVCFAVANDISNMCGGVWNWNVAATFAAAQKMAVDACNSHGGAQCQPRGGVCNNPPPPPPPPPPPHPSAPSGPMNPIDPDGASHNKLAPN